MSVFHVMSVCHVSLSGQYGSQSVGQSVSISLSNQSVSIKTSMAFRELTVSATGVRYFHGVPRLDHFGQWRPLLPWRSAN